MENYYELIATAKYPQQNTMIQPEFGLFASNESTVAIKTAEVYIESIEANRKTTEKELKIHLRSNSL